MKAESKWFYPIDCFQAYAEITEGIRPEYMTAQKCYLEICLSLNGLFNFIALLYVMILYLASIYTE